MDWKSIFEEAIFEPGATAQQIQHLIHTVPQSLSTQDVDDVKSGHVPFRERGKSLDTVTLPFDITQWSLPTRPLPASFLDFLRVSNGGYARNGERRFDSFFGTDTIREMLLAYEFPEYMPDVVPFAFDGGGNFYVFDMRHDPIDNEYPILFCHSGNLGCEEAVYVAASFLEACTGTTDPGGSDTEVEPLPLYDLLLDGVPTNRLQILALIREVTHADLRRAKQIIDTLPASLARGKTFEITPLKDRFEAAGASVRMIISQHNDGNP
jgi:ribosomal protein L7/L12